jgi:hypothetical protein
VSRPRPSAERAGAQGRALLLASGAVIFLVGIALTFGCLTLARAEPGVAGGPPASPASPAAGQR